MMTSSSLERLKQIVEPLLSWYQLNKRSLPWRENISPYRVWVSEIMLQQTRVEAVKPYFERFLTELPTIRALADCPEERLIKLWEGLGYYSRVKNMQKAAKQIVEQYNGIFPQNYEQIKSLSGIGDYTAGAIASIAFDLPVPAVDGNVLRVLTRILLCSDDISSAKTKESFRQLLLQAEPSPGAGDFNQSLMELGATVCLPNGAPQCLLCPLNRLCLAHLEKQETDFPVKSPKKPRKVQERTLFLFFLSFDDKIDGNVKTLLCRRKEKGVLSGMWEFPAVESLCSQQQAEEFVQNLFGGWKLQNITLTPAKPSKHIFTHIEWKMNCFVVSARATDEQAISSLLPDRFLLTDIRELDTDNLDSSIALPSAFQAYRPLFKQTDKKSFSK